MESVCPITFGLKVTQHFSNGTPTVNYGGVSGMVQVCFAAPGPERLALVNGAMNSAVYKNIMKENVQPCVHDLKLEHTWVLQQDNDPKYTSKFTSEWLKTTTK